MNEIEKSIHKPTTKKIAVIGGGNVGTFLATAILNGSKLEKYDLTIVENNKIRREQISRQGVGYEAGTGIDKIITTISPKNFRVANSMTETTDIVFAAIKSYQLTPEIYQKEIAPFLHENSKVVLVQNGYPNPEILAALENKAVIMVVNAGFSLEKQGAKTVTLKKQIDLPYGSLTNAISCEELESEVGQVFLENSPELLVRYDKDIIKDVMKKAQYACIGAYCAVEAFKSRHPHDKKFTFGNLVTTQKEEIGKFTSAVVANKNARIEKNISNIAKEVEAVAGFSLLSFEELQERRKINAKLENSLVYDARNGCKMERGIVDNLLKLAQASQIETPELNKLSQALKIIELDGWKLELQNIQAVNLTFSTRAKA